MTARVLAAAIAVSSLAPAARAQSPTTFQLCGVESDVLKSVVATYNPVSKDTLVDGQRFSTRFRYAYAPARDWFKEASRNFLEKDYLKYGLPRRISPGDLRIFVYHTGVPVFIARSDTARTAEIVYVSYGPACEFQPYQEATAEQLHAAGAEAYGKGQFASARATLQMKTLLAHGPSLVLQGHMFAAGEGVARDTAYARKLYTRAIAAGDPDGWAGFARLASAAGNESAALTLYRAAADQGSGAGAAQMAARYLAGRGVTASAEEAAYYLRIAIDRLDERSPLRDSVRTSLADLYATGRGVRRDASAHFARDLAAARNGDRWAQYLMGRRYETAMSVLASRDFAVEFYKASAARRYEPAMRALDRLGVSYR